MNKVLAVMIAGLFAAGAFAQSAEKAPITDTKPQARAEAKVMAKPAGKVAAPGGDKSAEGGAIGTDKAAVAGEAREKTRDARRRNKDGTIKRRTTQGGTPNN